MIIIKCISQKSKLIEFITMKQFSYKKNKYLRCHIHVNRKLWNWDKTIQSCPVLVLNNNTYSWYGTIEIHEQAMARAYKAWVVEIAAAGLSTKLSIP